MAKIMIFVLALAFVAAVSAIGGVKDIAGNYYDLTTGQVSSSLTGRVYNTGYSAPIVAPYASYAYASPYYGGYASPYAPLAYGLLK